MAKEAVAPAGKAHKAMVLEAPRTLSEEPLYNLLTTVRAQFADVYLTENGNRIATIVNTDKKKETKIGSANTDFLCGLVIGAMGGRGDAPGGAAIWVGAERSKMEPHLNKYTLTAVPKSRGGTLEAPVPVWLDACSGKAKLLVLSVEKYPIPKRVRDTTTGAEEEQVDVWL